MIDIKNYKKTDSTITENDSNPTSCNCAKNTSSTRNVHVYHIDIPEEITDYIESLQYEVEARKSLLNYCMGHGINTENPVFKRYHEEFIDVFIQYEQSKNELTEKYVTKEYPNSNWNLDFSTSVLTVTVEE